MANGKISAIEDVLEHDAAEISHFAVRVPSQF